MYSGQCLGLWASVTASQDPVTPQTCNTLDSVTSPWNWWREGCGQSVPRTKQFLGEPAAGKPTSQEALFPSGNHVLILKLNLLNKDWLTPGLVLITYSLC